MKAYILVLLFLSSLSHAQETKEENSWDLYQFKIYFENDMFGDFTDAQYSSGEKFNLTYHVNNPKNGLYDLLVSDGLGEEIFLTFNLSNQIYTPVDLTETELIEDDRPYAGWTYVEAGMHKSTNKTMNSLSLKVGMIGPASCSQEIQTGIHKLVNAGLPKGWDNQLSNELGVNLSYIYKQRYAPKPVFGWLESAVIPYGQINLGNVSTLAALGTFVRVGYNIPKDFGLATMNIGGESNIPAYDENLHSLEKNWSLSFNISLTGSAVARDIFLDGNTFKSSHSVDKNIFVAYASVGLSARYKTFTIDVTNTRNTKKGDKEGPLQDVGTVIVSWQF